MLAMSLAVSTRTTYESGRRQYVNFARMAGLIGRDGIVPVPTEEDLMYYATFRAAFHRSSVAYIRVLVASVASWFAEGGYGSILTDAAGSPHPKLSAVIRGIKREYGAPKKNRLPVTTTVLRRLVNDMRSWGDADADMYAACMSLAVYGMLRQSEFTSAGVRTHDESRGARRSDAWFERDARGDVECMCYFVRCSKVDPFRRSATLRLFPTGTAECPVAAMARYLAATAGADPAGPLFIRADGSFLTRARLGQRLTAVLRRVGYKGAHLFTTHSFRQGGAVSAACAGHDADTVISVIGRWAGDSYKQYLTLDRAHLRRVAVSMSRVTTADVEAWGDRGWGGT
jgi:hypothetical protein